jgi:cytochrome d ubiquinol oxidase subunit II
MTGNPNLLAGIWFWLLGFILLLYVILDGFDLGAAVLFLGTTDAKRRALIRGGLGYTWHANQTWLVVLGGLLFGAFPLAYGLVLSALYLPIGLMLLGLILRSVSFEFQEEARYKVFWDLAFGGGSLLAALAQGFVLGGVIGGLKVAGDSFAGGVWDWLTPFSLLVAVGLVCGYMLLGAAYLVIKTEGEMQQYCRDLASMAAFLAFVLALAAVIWSWYANPAMVQKWLTWPGLWITTFPALLAALAFFWLLNTLRAGKIETAPFTLAVLFFAFAFVSLAGSLYPFILPPAVTIEAAAAPSLTLEIMLLVMVPLLPIMLIYNAYQYRVFRGKAGVAGYRE